ncbi:U3 small nucleolar RNA-associated protein 15 homolog [Oppia nitens]|uniref:U3 small nucleolar RNA-associated protein 15 homolog n=1 Tax=Oppia nitens TaxID=1686743 RepID=UPI0023DCD522|nr:U3 small nucleolar RNA-associated protein 15 homolog [Oppia nitens]
MTDFKTTTLATLPSIVEPLSDSAKYWQNLLDSAKVAKEFSGINCMDIGQHSHDILVTSSSRLALYEYYSMEVKRSFSAPNFVQLYGGTYRKSDSKLIVCGGADGVVRVWDITNSKPLRALGLNSKHKTLKHSSAVRRSHFSGNSNVISFGDDYHIKVWDITEEALITTFGDNKSAHNDYIRASYVMDNSSTIVSGSYDQTVKVWDQRSPLKTVNEFNFGSPVESITVRNMMAIAAGGDAIKIYDLIAGKVLKTLSKTHHKTITCVYNYGQYLLTASIDGHLKVYDSNFNIATSLTYTPSQLLSCALDDKVLAVGANDGLFSVNKFKTEEQQPIDKYNKRFRNRYFNGQLVDSETNKRKIDYLEQFVVVKGKHKYQKLSKHEEALKKFNHTSALNTVLNKHSNEPEVIVSFMQELIRRGALRAALAARNDKQLRPIFRFLLNYFKDPRFNRILVDVALMLSDLYMNQINRSDEIRYLFNKLNSVVNLELNCVQQMLSISGQLSAIVNSSIS